MNPLNLRLVTSHALAMVVAALLALALAGCGNEAGEHATSVTPEVAAGSDETAAPLVERVEHIDLDDEEAVSPTAVEEPVTPRPVAEARAEDIEVRRIVATTAIENREPVDDRELFSEQELENNGRVFAFFDLRNASDTDARVSVVFVSPSGIGHGQVELTIPANARRWRTWAFTRALATGFWNIELRGADDSVIAERRFEVRAP